MRKILLERRTKMLNHLSKQIPIGAIAQDLAREYGVSVDAIYQDHHRLVQWAPHILQLHDDALAYELVNNIKQVIPNAWFEYKQADNSNAKIGALRLVVDTTLKLAQLLQSLGKMEKVVEAIEFRVRWLNEQDTADSHPVPST